MVLEISKKILNRMYGGDSTEARQKAIADGYCIEWTKERIKNVFNSGNGTKKHLKEYMENNKQYCVFIRI